MRIAVPVSNDRTAETLSGIEGFQFFEDDHGRIVRRFFVPRAGEGAAAAVAQLEPYGVDALVCGALPGDERLETAAAGILLFPTFSGTPEEAARQRALEGIGDHDALFHALCLPCGSFFL